jgi:hypothetical protein
MRQNKYLRLSKMMKVIKRDLSQSFSRENKALLINLELLTRKFKHQIILWLN